MSASFLPSPSTAAAKPYGLRRPQAGPLDEDSWCNTHAELAISPKAFPSWVRGVVNDPNPKLNGLYVCLSVSDDYTSSVWERILTLDLFEELIQTYVIGGGGFQAYAGEGAPDPLIGKTGDWYLNQNNGELFQKQADGWDLLLTLKGKDGDNLPGTTIGFQAFNGLGAPDPLLGNTGDWYLNQETGELFHKLSTGWELLMKIKGEKGEDASNPEASTPRVYTGTAVPQPDQGNQYDFYIRFNGQMYEKLDGTWESRGKLDISGSTGTISRVLFWGTVPPDQNTDLPTDLADGCLYLNTTNGNEYGLEGGDWNYLLNIKGPAGEGKQGIPGLSVVGPAGNSGTIHYIRTADPTDDFGKDGELVTRPYTIKTEKRFYKVSGHWVKYYDNTDGTDSSPITATVPGPPTAVIGTPGTQQISVQWTAPVYDGNSPITGYNVYLANSSTKYATNVANPWLHTNLTAGTGISYQVSALNAIGESSKSLPSAVVIPTGDTTPPTTPKAVLTFGALANKTVGDAPVTLSASSTNTVTPITFTSSNSAVVSVAQTNGVWQATIVSAGSATISASQAAGNNFLAADSVGRAITVSAVTAPKVWDNIVHGGGDAVKGVILAADPADTWEFDNATFGVNTPASMDIYQNNQQIGQLVFDAYYGSPTPLAGQYTVGATGQKYLKTFTSRIDL